MFKNTNLKKQKGQSLLYVAVLIVILISGVFYVYDMGRMVNTKIEFQNGADAAALAAVSVKISKHHTDALVRTSMFHESLAAQTQQRAAQALLAQILLDIKPKPVTPPGGVPGREGSSPVQPGPIMPGPITPSPITPILAPTQKQIDQAKEYKRLVNLTYRHVIKMHRERLALEEYYRWLSDSPTGGAASEAVLDAARIGLRANISNSISDKNPVLAENLKLLTDRQELLENRNFTYTIGGIAYANEGTRMNAAYGKTFVEFNAKGVTTSQGVSFLKYLNQYTLTSNASAKIVSAEELRPNDRTLIRIPIKSDFPLLLTGGATPNEMIFLPFEMHWFSPSLMAIELKTDVTLH